MPALPGAAARNVSLVGRLSIGGNTRMDYARRMTFTQRIPADRLLGLDVHEGDTLHVVARLESSFVVQVSRADDLPSAQGKVGEWLRSAKGSVRLNAGETVDEARMDYYAAKHGIAK